MPSNPAISKSIERCINISNNELEHEEIKIFNRKRLMTMKTDQHFNKVTDLIIQHGAEYGMTGKHVSEYTYDQNGCLVELRESAPMTPWPMLSRLTKYDNKYDSEGNLIRYDAIIKTFKGDSDEQLFRSGAYVFNQDNSELSYSINTTDSKGYLIHSEDSETIYDAHKNKQEQIIISKNFQKANINEFTAIKKIHLHYFTDDNIAVEEIKEYEKHKNSSSFSHRQTTIKTELSESTKQVNTDQSNQWKFYRNAQGELVKKEWYIDDDLYRRGEISYEYFVT